VELNAIVPGEVRMERVINEKTGLVEHKAVKDMSDPEYLMALDYATTIKDCLEAAQKLRGRNQC
jgi:hypothetical protein